MVIPVSRSAGNGLRVLIGKRRSRFLGGFYAFPGGAFDPEDADPGGNEDLSLRRTAARELYEETGLSVPPGELLDAGRRVTPPFFPRRFDTAMYVAAVDGEPGPEPASPGEMEDLHWCGAAEAMRRWRSLEIRVAPPLIPMLQELDRCDGASEAADVAARLSRRNAEMEGGHGPHIEFVPDVLMVPLETVTLPPATTTNCYLVGSREFVVIDPGGHGEEAERLIRHARELLRRGGTVRAVVLTHHHGDHVGGAAAVAEELDAPVAAHPETWRLWEAPSGIRREELHDGDILELSGGERLRVLHTPGHAAGHVALLEEKLGSLFAGDLVSGLSTILVDPGPGELDRYLESLRRIRDAGARTLFPAHGPPMISPARDVQRVLDHREQREARIVEALSEGPLGIQEIVRSAYADTPGAPPSLARTQTEAHLGRLVGLGRVCREGRTWKLSE